LIVLFYRPRGETTAARLSKAHGSGIGDDALKDAVNLAAGLNLEPRLPRFPPVGIGVPAPKVWMAAMTPGVSALPVGYFLGNQGTKAFVRLT